MLLCGLLFLFSGATPAKTPNDPSSVYRLGILPYLSTSRIEQAYAPLAAAFAKLLGRPVRLGTAKDVEAYHQRMLKNDFDIALVPPFAVVPLVDERGFTPLARRPSHPSRIVVLINSPLKQVNDLRHTTLGLPPAHSPVNAIIKANLSTQGLHAGQDFQTRHYPSTPACLHNLLVNRVDACASDGDAGLRTFERKMGVKMRTLYQTEAFPHMLFVTRPGFPAANSDKLQRFILDLGNTPQGRELLKQIGPGARFIPYRSTDYDVMRRYRKIMQRDAQTVP